MYYILRQPSESNIVGVKDGGIQAEFIRDGFKNKNIYDDIVSFSNSDKIGDFPDFALNLEYVKMRTEAKLTDFISFYPHIPFGQYLISKHVVDILSTFKMSKHVLYPATIDYNGTLIDSYSLLYNPAIEIIDMVNVHKSIFYTGFLSKKFHAFKNKEEYLELSKKTLVKADKVFLTENFDRQLDFFILTGTSEPYISKELKETFELADITGIKFVEAKEPELYFEE